MGRKIGADLVLIAARDRHQQIEEVLRRLRQEHRRGDHHEIGVSAVAEIEAERHALDVVLGVIRRFRITAAE